MRVKTHTFLHKRKEPAENSLELWAALRQKGGNNETGQIFKGIPLDQETDGGQ